MKAQGLVFLAADTPRSRAYAQALAARGIELDRSLLIRSPERKRWGQADAVESGNRDFGDLFAPELGLPLEESLERLGEVEVSDAGSANDPAIVAWLRDAGASLAIYSGFGGQIVRSELLAAGPPLLHLHSGWLPDYRGSTTLYYSYLTDGSCGVTAILLRESIDTGPIVGRKRYPPPPPGAEVDYCYDSAIRADLLVAVIEGWVQRGELERIAQPPGEGRDYYIVHPVLKHVALNRIHAR